MPASHNPAIVFIKNQLKELKDLKVVYQGQKTNAQNELTAVNSNLQKVNDKIDDLQLSVAKLEGP